MNTAGIRLEPWLTAVTVFTLLPALASVEVRAERPRVRFDFPHAVECRDVTPKEFADLYPHRKVIEAVVHISARLIDGSEEDLNEFAVEMRSHSEQMQVADFLPRSTLESDVTGEIEIEETHETIDRHAASVGASPPIPYGELTFQMTPSADIGRTRRTTRTETRKQHPPRRVVVSSGTTHNEHGVFFKLRPSRELAFEDVHEFTVRFIVPHAWRGDWIQVMCRVDAIRTWLVFSKPTSGETNVYLGLHLAGDAEAKQAAHRLAHAQIRFLASPRSIRERLASTFSSLVERSPQDVTIRFDTFGLENDDDVWLVKGGTGRWKLPGESPDAVAARGLSSACDAMRRFGG